MVGKDGWRVGKANEARIGIKIAEGRSGVKCNPPFIYGKVIQATGFVSLMDEIHEPMLLATNRYYM